MRLLGHGRDAPADFLCAYAAVTGRAPMLPEWAAGFWQCKLRYRTQDELLDVAREYKRRGLPLSVIVVDYFHWTQQGDWRFDPEEWPDPGGMVAELDRLGVKLMVSVWPTVNPASDNYAEMNDRACSSRTSGDSACSWASGTGARTAAGAVTFYDATNPEAREYIWAKVRTPTTSTACGSGGSTPASRSCVPEQPGNLRYHLGPGARGRQPLPDAARAGLLRGHAAEGEDEIVPLCRSAWAGSQRYGAPVWSGDIDSTFEALRRQIPAGLNIGLSGIPWWTTDIGGFKTATSTRLLPRAHRPLVPVRRVLPAVPAARDPAAGHHVGRSRPADQRGLVLRRGGVRDHPAVLVPAGAAAAVPDGAVATRTPSGLPPMRPLFLDFPPTHSWEVEDQFMFGDDILVAPVIRRRPGAPCVPAGRAASGWTPGPGTGRPRRRAGSPRRPRWSLIPVYVVPGNVQPVRPSWVYRFVSSGGESA